MEYRILADTVQPLFDGHLPASRFTAVYPRLSRTRPVCPSEESFRAACQGDGLHLVLTAPAQLSGAYASAVRAVAARENAVVIDSRTFGAGQLLLIHKAAELASRDRFSVRVVRDVRRASQEICCYFVAPQGNSFYLSGGKRHGRLFPFQHRIYAVGGEGDIRFCGAVAARSPEQALFRWVLPHIEEGAEIAVVHDRAARAANWMCAEFGRLNVSILRGESIRTDLPFGEGGFLSVAYGLR